MKKTLTILSAVLITIISFNAKAQDTKSTTPKDPGAPVDYVKSYIGFFGGVSIPVSDYGKSVYSNNKAGFAKKGATFGLDGVYYFYKNLGFGLNASFQDQGELNSTDVQNLANGYNASYNKDQTTTTAVNRYHSFNIMGGPQYSFTYKKFILDLRASAGVIKSISTTALTSFFDGGTNGYFYQNSSGAKEFAYGGTIGLRWSFSDSWDVNLRGNYINCAGFPITNVDNPGTEGRLVTKLPFTVFQTTLGLTLHL
jgi:hypothetical protein